MNQRSWSAYDINLSRISKNKQTRRNKTNCRENLFIFLFLSDSVSQTVNRFSSTWHTFHPLDRHSKIKIWMDHNMENIELTVFKYLIPNECLERINWVSNWARSVSMKLTWKRAKCLHEWQINTLCAAVTGWNHRKFFFICIFIFAVISFCHTSPFWTLVFAFCLFHFSHSTEY